MPCLAKRLGTILPHRHYLQRVYQIGLVEVLDVVFGKLVALDHADEEAEQALCLIDGFALDEAGHHVGGCLADGAAVPRERGLLDDVVGIVDLQVQGEFVTAARVDAVVTVRRVLEFVAVIGMGVVIHQRSGVDAAGRTVRH